MKRYIKSSEDTFTSELYDLVEHTVEQFIYETDEDADYDIDTYISDWRGKKWFNVDITTSLGYKDNESLMYKLNNVIIDYTDTGFDINSEGLDMSVEIPE